MAKIVGIKRSEISSGKNEGKIGITYYFIDSFSGFDLENSVCDGCLVGSEFAYKDYGVSVGDEVALVYSKGFGGKAFLENIIPVPKPASAPKRDMTK